MEVATMEIAICDLKALFRAQEILSRLLPESESSVPDLERAIDFARAALEAQLGRRRYLLEMLPNGVAYALPGLHGGFVAELAEAGRFELKADLPIVLQIAALELAYEDRAIQVVHRVGPGLGEREYRL
jgi:catechol 2,3-dioxygenase-like lactoylglutathione lyase family enzyme